jgi:hypothetical protein
VLNVIKQHQNVLYVRMVSIKMLMVLHAYLVNLPVLLVSMILSVILVVMIQLEELNPLVVYVNKNMLL